jgi:hypothetical protein
VWHFVFCMLGSHLSERIVFGPVGKCLAAFCELNFITVGHGGKFANNAKPLLFFRYLNLAKMLVMSHDLLTTMCKEAFYFAA